MERILSLGVAPALQRTMVYESFKVGDVNRAKAVEVSAAGKAVNVGLALATLGCKAIVTGFNGGPTGRIVADGLKARGVDAAFTRMAAPTRTCTTIIDLSKGGVATELVEESPRPDADGWKRFARANMRAMADCGLVAISGTLPPGAPEDLYAQFAMEAEKRAIPLVIDSHKGGILAVLPYHPLVAKMNVHELRLTFGDPCNTERQILKSAARLTSAGATWAFITNGAKPCWLISADGRAWRIAPARLDKVVNPIGSGDSVTAGLASAWLGGHPMNEAARFGIACGTANAVNLRPADFTLSQVRRFFRETKASKI